MLWKQDGLAESYLITDKKLLQNESLFVLLIVCEVCTDDSVVAPNTFQGWGGKTPFSVWLPPGGKLSVL